MKGKQPTTTPTRRKAAPADRPGGDLRFTRRNYLALGAALVAIAVGYGLLATGSITAAPVLLVLGYCVLVPYGLAAGHGEGEGSSVGSGANSSAG